MQLSTTLRANHVIFHYKILSFLFLFYSLILTSSRVNSVQSQFFFKIKDLVISYQNQSVINEFTLILFIAFNVTFIHTHLRV